jgi:lysophospholipase L1-like esterase
LQTLLKALRATVIAAGAAAVLGAIAIPVDISADEITPVTVAPPCKAALDVVRLANPLPRLARKLAAGDPVTIVAIGSSSTAGAGASSPAASYPSRLQADLSAEFPRSKIVVVNRGVGGEETKDMLRRFDTAVIAAHPDLVLWQLGTNSVIRDHPVIDHGAWIRDGINQIKLEGSDIILIDPQFAPKVIVKPEAERMVDLIEQTAKLEGVDLFHRYALMRRWHDVDRLAFEAFVSPDGLHMNDWSYACVAKSLAAAITEAVNRPVSSASALSPR